MFFKIAITCLKPGRLYVNVIFELLSGGLNKFFCFKSNVFKLLLLIAPKLFVLEW